MVCNNLIIDLSEEYVTLHCRGINYISDIGCSYFWNNIEDASKRIGEEIKSREFDCVDLIISLPIACINHQIVTLPENVSDKDKLIFLGLEINRKLIGERFSIKRLDVTKRQEESGQELCDYLLLAPKTDVYNKLEVFAKVLGHKIVSVIPSFYLLDPEKINELRATAWLGDDRSEIVIWGKDNPLTLASIPNNGDQISDINRFIVEYFDHVDNLNLSMIYLYGPRMRDSGLGFGLTYPHVIFDEPVKFLSRNLYKAVDQSNIASITKLPRAPIPMTPRNITFISSAVLMALIIFLSGFVQADNLRLRHQLSSLEQKSRKHRSLIKKLRTLQQQKTELGAEKEFYLDITKRRTPWERIFTDIARSTPKEVWFERLNASKNRVLIIGKARGVDDVSDLAINLNDNSSYIQDALIVGTRDYEDENNNATYSEFQISAKLKSPSGKFEEGLN